MIIALFPPNSNKDFPKRAPTLFATSLPIRVDPVAETKAIRWSSASHFPTSESPLSRQETPSDILFSFKTSLIIC